MIRSAVIILVIVSGLAILLSALAGIPYIYTACAVAAIVFLGHLVTLDDDRIGGWNNEFEEKEIWHQSLKELFLKLSVILILLLVIFTFPGITNLGK